MAVGTREFTLYLFGTQCLKDKRRVIKGLLERLRQRFHVSAAEVASQDNWRETVLEVAFVSGDYGHIEQVLTAVENYISDSPDIEIVTVDREYL